MNFGINISGVDVSEYVIYDQFDGVVLEAEDDTLHSFWTSVVNVTFYFEITDLINNLEKKRAVITWFGRKIFDGYVNDVQYDEVKNEIIDIELVSTGYLINNFVLESDFKTFNQEEGDSISFMVDRLRQTAERALISGGYTDYLLEINVKDDIDFIDLKTAILQDSIQNTPKSKMIVRSVTPTFYQTGAFKSFVQGEDVYILDVIQGAETTDTTVSRVILGNSKVELVDTTEETVNQVRYSEDYVYFEQEAFPRYVIINEAEDNMIDYFKDFLSNSDYWDVSSDVTSDQINIKSNAKINEQFYLLECTRKSKYFTFLIEISQKDNFRYNYETGTKLGKILKDIAIISDSILWVDEEKTINIVDRVSSENNPEISSFDVLNYDEKTVNYINKKIDLPSEIELLNTETFPVKDNILDHYSEIINGNKKITTAEILVSEDSAYLDIRMLKNQVINDLSGDAGQVKKIHFKDESMEITAETRYVESLVL